MKSLFTSKWFLFISVTVIGFALDAYTKHLAVVNLRMGEMIPVIGTFGQLLLVYNKAAVFGLDPRHLFPSFPLNAFFIVFNCIAMVLIVAYYYTLKKSEKLMHWGIAFVMPGAIGNLFDRFAHPGRGVVDFLRLGVSETLYWPIFNVADIFVTIGVIIICINFLLETKKPAVSAPTQDMPPLAS